MPRRSSHQDIAADYFALRKVYTGTRWVFNEGRNTFNPASHCDIAWAGALASHAHPARRDQPWAMVVYYTEEEQNRAPNRGYYGIEPPPLPPPTRVDPNQDFSLACGICAHRPKSFSPVPHKCQKCGLFLPPRIA